MAWRHKFGREMVIGILSVKNHRYHSNRRLLEAARLVNHQAILVHPKKLFMGAGDEGLSVDHLSRHFRVDVILPRLGASIREYALTMVRHFELLGIPAINRFESILLARNKFLTLQALIQNGIPVPESRYASNWSNFEKAISKFGGFPLVIKTRNSRQGRGVSLIHSMEESKPLLDSLLNRGQGILIQRFIPPEKRRDIRLMVIGEEVIGGMSLKPTKKDFRANIHLRARSQKINPTEEMSMLARKSTNALGLDISGVDMIEERGGGLRVIDVNYTPGFKGFEKCTGKDVAFEIIKYVIRSHG